ncbi:hypothetical protein L7F22_038375 [Adiantum nelumboides]|nr:hypothetical protein [Adiantum nelumboides]
MQGLKARIKELEELNHRLLAELRGKQVEGASGSAGAGGSGGAGEDVVGGAGTGGEGIGGKGTKRRRERDEEDAGESALKQVFKKAKLNEFNGEKKTGEDLEAWIEELEDFFALREFSEEAKAKVAIVQLRSVAKLWWKSYMQTRSRVGPVLWEEFRDQAEKRYCSPHYNMEKKMEFYNFKQREEDKHSLSVDEYKEKFLRLHKYAPEVTGNALKSKFIEGLREELKYQVKGSGCTDFLDAVAKAENFEKMEEFTMKKAASARNRVIATGHRPQGSTVPSSRFNSNQTWVNYGQRNNNNNNQRIANNNQRPNTQVNGGQNDNQKKRQPVRWQQDSEFLERARRLGLCFRCGEQGHRTFECPNKAITAPMQAKVTELDATIEEASEGGAKERVSILSKGTLIMSQDNQGNRINIDNMNLALDVTTNEGRSIVNYLVGKLQEAMGNPTLQMEVQGQIQHLQVPPSAQEETVLERPLHETFKKGTSLSNEKEMREEPPSQSTKDSVMHQELSKERDGSDTPITFESDVAPRRRRTKRSPSPVKK